MIRTQIQLTELQMEAVRAAAEHDHISIAELLRRALDTSLAGSVTTPKAELKRRAIAVAGRFSSGRPDVSTAHDTYLDEAYGAGLVSKPA